MSSIAETRNTAIRQNGHSGEGNLREKIYKKVNDQLRCKLHNNHTLISFMEWCVDIKVNW